jgi:hypothetical protein
MSKKSVFQLLKERQEAREQQQAEVGLTDPAAPAESDTSGDHAPIRERTPTRRRPRQSQRRLSVLISLGAVAPLPTQSLTSQQGVEDDA